MYRVLQDDGSIFPELLPVNADAADAVHHRSFRSETGNSCDFGMCPGLKSLSELLC